MKTEMNELQQAINEIRCEKLRATCDVLLCPEFEIWPAATKYHHAYKGGLLAHTLEVVKYCKIQAFGMNGVDMDVLLTAALWHDYGKIFEYSDLGEKKPYAYTVGHICGGAALFGIAASAVGIEKVRAVQHCILSHHGRKEWGSPVEPQTLEALILHQADMLSAKYGETK